MYQTLLTSALTLFAIAAAQTPPNFNVTVSTELTVIIQPSNISITPSLLASQAQTRDEPWVYVPSGADTSNTYLVILIDSGVPLLHWLQPNLVTNSSRNLTFNAVVQDASAAVGAPYLYPQPPSGVLHDYVFLLYQQPDNWAFPTNYSTFNPPASSSARRGFEIADFQMAAGLSSPIAANYMRVLNGTSQLSSSLISATQTAFTASSASATASATGSASGSASASATASANAGSYSVLQNTYGAAGMLAVVAEAIFAFL